MKCGHCKSPDVTIEHVRQCSGTPNRRARRDAVLPEQRGPLSADLQTARAAVSEGHYALKGDSWRFYHVGKPVDGKWAGFTFLAVQAGDEYHRLPNIETELRVLLEIGADPAEASRAYGRQIGRCGVCSRTLTREESIAAGVGPICAKNMGW